MSRVVIFALVILSALVVGYLSRKIKAETKHITKFLVWSSMLQLGLLALLLILQFLIVRLSFSELITALVIETAIFCAPILAILMVRSFSNIKAYMHAYTAFSISFSALYLLMLLINGMPEGRDSVLGIVSSNFCAAVLYLVIPILLYYLLAPGIRKTKKERKAILLALLLSLLVILTTGSRTALGALVIIIFFLFMYSTKNKRARKLVFRIIAVVLIVGIVMFITMPQMQNLLQRAISAFTEEGGVSNDVRSVLVWSNAIGAIRNGNYILGSGTNIMDGQYEIPAHNIWLEIMMSCGILGLILWLIMIICSIRLLMLTHDRSKKYFGGMLLALYLFMGMLQPFLSTGYMCGLLIWLSFYVIVFSKRM